MTTQDTYTPMPWEVVGKVEEEDGEVSVVSTITQDEVCQVFGGDEIEANARLIAAAPELFNVLKYMNHMGGDERGGYCICPLNNGSAPDKKHSTSCADARKVIARIEGRR